MLSTTSKYALRAVVAISERQGGALVLGRELAAKVGIPRHYLSKVLGTLCRIGILTAARGTKGGYRLARSPAHIALAEIVEAFGVSTREPTCVMDERHACGGDHICGAHARWANVHSAFADFLEGTRVADLYNQNPPHSARNRTKRVVPRDRQPPAANSNHGRRTLADGRPMKSKMRSRRGGFKHD
jgi:Rrf2 family protein